MHKDIAVKIQNVSKVYKLYDKPIDRLKESLNPFKKKYHKDFYALKNINLEIKKGEVLGIVGVNGAGKSTLLKIISDVLTPTTGRVNIHGRINAILELGSALKPELTGRENIKLNLQINGIEKDREKLTQEMIEFADIGEHIDQPIKSYSSGMKARLGFAIATSTDPDILIVDEVLAVGDVLFQRKCHSKIEKLFKDGKTVIFVSHSAQSVIEFCSRAVLLYDREIIMDDTPKKVTNYYQKLVFTKDKKKVIDEINEKVELQKEKPKKEVEKGIELDKKFYYPDLKVTPEIHKYNFDVDLSDFKILDDRGRQVNILTYGSEYIFRFQATYQLDGEVSIGSQIITEKGLIISGASTANQKYLYSVQHGDTILVSYRFKCLLTQGVYFFNSSTSLFSNNMCQPLVKALNSYVFKVKKNDTSFVGRGFIDLEQNIGLERV